MTHSIYNGEERLPFTLPKKWEILPYTLPPETNREKLSASQLTWNALEDYFVSGADILIAPGKNVAIIIDDAARPTPAGEMLPALYEALLNRGVRREDIDLIIGLGTHAAMGEEALQQKLGKEVLKDYRVSQHDCHAKDLVPVTRLQSGTEVRINPIAARADIRIGIGSIFPHPMNGFGGGPKIVFPGIVNYEAIREHHLRHTVHPKSIYGNIDGNPFYEEIQKVARLAGLHYSLNCIFDTRERVAEVLFGPYDSVHRKGAERSKEICGMNFSEKSEVTLISAYPYMEPFQIMKPMIIGSLITRPGGTVLLVAKTRDRLPPSFVEVFERIQNASSGSLGDFVVNEFRSGRLLLESAAVDFNCALFFAMFCKSVCRIGIISENLGRDDVERMGFTFYENLEEALAAESGRQPAATVNLAPVGGILPVLPQALNMGY
jgi:nickel-dependent lactate racemase